MKEKTCYSCHEKKPMEEMLNMGVWVCKSCYEKLDNSDKKKKK